ncbi:carbohydrate ABC transporter permease [Paenibacillus silvisoli]|uniref:carbohydrate ABC transporter permease n=1 Tax=Paenibacillus silvisoli TaxID=3110539 RepID=UPI002804ACD0|nr:carbohydrate ABC transporter permease [Paenibacillus silvisoli]
MSIQNKFTWTDMFIYFVLAAGSLMIFIPLWRILVISFSAQEVYLLDNYNLIPKSFSLTEYKRAFGNIGGIANALFNTVKITALGTTISMLLTSLGAYALSKSDLPGRNMMFRFLIFTMFFSGGLVPFYVLVRNLDFIDTIWSLVLPTAVSTYNLIIMKNYFASLPPSLEEAAKIDGYNDIQILFKIIIPISAPVFAAVSLFYGVALWNDYFLATLFINSNELFPLQVILRQMIIQDMVTAEVGISTTGSNMEQFKMACIVIGMVPVLVIYPFVQKYFTKGIMLGAVKE